MTKTGFAAGGVEAVWAVQQKQICRPDVFSKMNLFSVVRNSQIEIKHEHQLAFLTDPV